MHHPQRLAGLPFFVDRYKNRKLLVRVASDKLFHIAAAPPSLGFACSVSKTPLQRFHSIIIFPVKTDSNVLIDPVPSLTVVHRQVQNESEELVRIFLPEIIG